MPSLTTHALCTSDRPSTRSDRPLPRVDTELRVRVFHEGSEQIGQAPEVRRLRSGRSRRQLLTFCSSGGFRHPLNCEIRNLRASSARARSLFSRSRRRRFYGHLDLPSAPRRFGRATPMPDPPITAASKVRVPTGKTLSKVILEVGKDSEQNVELYKATSEGECDYVLCVRKFSNPTCARSCSPAQLHPQARASYFPGLRRCSRVCCRQRRWIGSGGSCGFLACRCSSRRHCAELRQPRASRSAD